MIPRRIFMDSLEWEVRLSDLGAEQHGECCGEECQVLIAKRLVEQMREVSFWHEVIHLLFRSRDFPGDKKYTEEEIATMLGPALYAFLSTNAQVTWKPHCNAA